MRTPPAPIAASSPPQLGFETDGRMATTGAGDHAFVRVAAGGTHLRSASLAFGVCAALGVAATVIQYRLQLGTPPSAATIAFFRLASPVIPGLAILAGFLAWRSRLAQSLAWTRVAFVAAGPILDRWYVQRPPHLLELIITTGVLVVGSLLLWREDRKRRGAAA